MLNHPFLLLKTALFRPQIRLSIDSVLPLLRVSAAEPRAECLGWPRCDKPQNPTEMLGFTMKNWDLPMKNDGFWASTMAIYPWKMVVWQSKILVWQRFDHQRWWFNHQEWWCYRFYPSKLCFFKGILRGFRHIALQPSEIAMQPTTMVE